jgi:hypothetical protein
VEVWFHAFIRSALNGSSKSASRCGIFILKKTARGVRLILDALENSFDVKMLKVKVMALQSEDRSLVPVVSCLDKRLTWDLTVCTQHLFILIDILPSNNVLYEIWALL